MWAHDKTCHNRAATVKKVNQFAMGIPESIVLVYIEMCPICGNQNGRAKKKPAGTAQPIRSDHFGHTMNLDLFDMRSEPDEVRTRLGSPLSPLTRRVLPRLYLRRSRCPVES